MSGVANRGGAGDDGLIQRFGLLVWPDQSGEWKEMRPLPGQRGEGEGVGDLRTPRPARPGRHRSRARPLRAAPVPALRRQGAGHFSEWRADLEKRLRAADLAPALESHFAKYRKLVPALALINHLADGGAGPIGEKALLRALAFAEYLETHARRAYGAGAASEAAAAKAILARIRKGDLQTALRRETSGARNGPA